MSTWWKKEVEAVRKVSEACISNADEHLQAHIEASQMVTARRDAEVAAVLGPTSKMFPPPSGGGRKKRKR